MATHKEQHDLQHIADEVGGTVREDYSGRGMMGATCYGIECQDATKTIEVSAGFGIRGAKIDNMGQGYIVYWPHIKG